MWSNVFKQLKKETSPTLRLLTWFLNIIECVVEVLKTRQFISLFEISFACRWKKCNVMPLNVLLAVFILKQTYSIWFRFMLLSPSFFVVFIAFILTLWAYFALLDQKKPKHLPPSINHPLRKYRKVVQTGQKR